jgi:hypothetical protein
MLSEASPECIIPADSTQLAVIDLLLLEAEAEAEFDLAGQRAVAL